MTPTLDKTPGEPRVELALLRARIDASRLVLPEIFAFGDSIAEIIRQWPVEAKPIRRIAILGALTTDFIARAVAVGVVQEDSLAVIYQAPFGSYVQQILDPNSDFYKFRPDVVLLAPDWRDLVDDLPIGAAAEQVMLAVLDKINLFKHLWTLVEQIGCHILQHSLVLPPRAWGGVAERLAPASPQRQVRAVNDGLFEAGRRRVVWIDMERIAAEVGSRVFAPDRYFYNGRLGMDNRHLPRYLAAFRGAWRLAHGLAKKVLVLDLDNTLWGGVIGDDGIDGIRLGQGSAVGEAFANWQQYLRSLRQRGIVLAACSKNDTAVAVTGFTHEASILKPTDFAAFHCSWDDKATGLRAIATSLNLGLSSMVFCDDNPAECDLVRRELPEVTVIEMGNDPTQFIDKLDAGHWLDVGQYTSEDLGRADMYASRAKAIDAAGSAPDIGGFLRGLQMKGSVWRPEDGDMARVAQLEMKTNQFNLTTRRYTETQLRTFLGQKEIIVLAFRLCDRFGDHGLASTLVAMPSPTGLRIDSWVMSCRIFSRTAEQFIMRALLKLAEQRGAVSVIGEYISTPRNEVVADLYSRLGFHAAESGLFERVVGDSTIGGLETFIEPN